MTPLLHPIRLRHVIEYLMGDLFKSNKGYA